MFAVEKFNLFCAAVNEKKYVSGHVGEGK